ncbi:MAG: transketolase [Verrucomicrobia bacterium]|nr:transketolase [Verrucomicrobiota bacterium]
MRNAFANAFYELARNDPRIVLVVADITAAAGVASFQKESPERFVNVGVAEQTMIGMCAGLALRGKIPFAYTIATFTIYRPFEQVRVDCCYQNLPVKLVGVGAGVNYSTLGGTHHAQEDVAVMSAIPNMTVLAPCDPAESALCTRACVADIPGPVYLRLGKAGEPDLTAGAPDPFRLGKVRCIRPGADVCLLSYGPITKMALDVAARIESERGRSVAVHSIHSLKPLDTEGIKSLLARFPAIAVIEEHAPFGGLGPQVKALAWDSGARCTLRTFALRDEFIHVYGSHGDLLKAHGLETGLLAREIGALAN